MSLSNLKRSLFGARAQIYDRPACDPAVANEVQRAREYSKGKQFRSAVEIYARLLQAGVLGVDAHTNFGWDLHRVIKDALSRSDEGEILPGDVREAKQYLATYMKLSVDKPSLLHTVMLQHALKLGGANQLKVMVFVRMWGLENLRPDEFERFKAPDGKTYPSVAERAIQQASKEAAADGQLQQIEYILPFLQKAMVRFPDNVWLKYNLVKLFKAAGRAEDARSNAVEFAKSKANEYWTWDLLGDLQAEASLRLACYCKAMLCSDDDTFVSGVRLKLARELADAGNFTQAKGEVLHVLEHKQRAGHRIPAEVGQLQRESWYSDATAIAPSHAFYSGVAKKADDLLFSNIPWMDACIGERFFIDGQDKPRRKLYLKTSPVPTEVSIPESRLPIRNVRDGTAVEVRGELDPSQGHRFTLHAMKAREGAPFDVLSTVVGVVDHVNASKGLFHCIADRDVQGTFPIAEFGHRVSAGDSVDLRCAVYYSKKGKGVRIVSAAPSQADPSTKVRKPFSAEIRVDRGMGFTESGIFLPPDLVSEHRITDGDAVSGIAALNFNKKRNEWGWKAIKVSAVYSAGKYD